MGAQLLTDLALETDPTLPAFFLGRLTSLVARQAASDSPTERRALGLAAFSAFLDCLDLGLGVEAHVFLAELRAEAARAERPAA